MTGGEPGIKLLMADDQKLFVESLKYVIEARAQDIRVVGIAGNGLEVISMADDTSPDIILMDVRMPIVDGVQATRAILEKHPSIKILMLTIMQDVDYVRTAIRFGAIGYLLKDIPPVELISSIRMVMSGVMQISPIVARKLIQSGGTDVEIKDERMLYIEPLSKREKEVLQLIIKAFNNKQIAEYLGVAEQTARNYVHNLYSRLGVSSRVQLIKVMGGLDVDNI